MGDKISGHKTFIQDDFETVDTVETFLSIALLLAAKKVYKVTMNGLINKSWQTCIPRLPAYMCEYRISRENQSHYRAQQR